jgi:hypothetical protein
MSGEPFPGAPEKSVWGAADAACHHVPRRCHSRFLTTSSALLRPLTISTALQASEFPRLPFSDFSSQLEASVRNPDGQASEGMNLRVIGVLDMVREGRTLGTVSMRDGIAAARAVGVRVDGDGRCPGVTEFKDPDTNKVLLSISCVE